MDLEIQGAWQRNASGIFVDIENGNPFSLECRVTISDHDSIPQLEWELPVLANKVRLQIRNRCVWSSLSSLSLLLSSSLLSSFSYYHHCYHYYHHHCYHHFHHHHHVIILTIVIIIITITIVIIITTITVVIIITTITITWSSLMPLSSSLLCSNRRSLYIIQSLATPSLKPRPL